MKPIKRVEKLHKEVEAELVEVLETTSQEFRYLARRTNELGLRMELLKLARTCIGALAGIGEEPLQLERNRTPLPLLRRLSISAQAAFNRLNMEHDEALLAVGQLLARDALLRYRQILRRAGAECLTEQWVGQYRVVIENFHRVTELRYRFA